MSSDMRSSEEIWTIVLAAVAGMVVGAVVIVLLLISGSKV